MPVFLKDMRCRGCRRQIGVAKDDDRVVFCDVQCATDYPAVSTEARDALVEAVHLTGKYPFAALGAQFGFSRQRAAQIVQERDIRKNP